MKDFAAVVLGKNAYEYTSGGDYCARESRWYVKKGYQNGFDLQDWETVINLAQKWGDKKAYDLHTSYEKGVNWAWFTSGTKTRWKSVSEAKNKSLLTAIMKAVVEAANGELL